MVGDPADRRTDPTRSSPHGAGANERRVIWWTASLIALANLVAVPAAEDAVPRDSTLEWIAAASLPLTCAVGLLLLVFPRTRVFGHGVVRGGFLVVLLALVVLPAAMFVFGQWRLTP